MADPYITSSYLIDTVETPLEVKLTQHPRQKGGTETDLDLDRVCVVSGRPFLQVKTLSSASFCRSIYIHRFALRRLFEFLIFRGLR